MVTKKTESSVCEDCKCDPCECGKNVSCSKGTCCGMSYGAYKIVRALVLIALIVGAYWLGTEIGEKQTQYEGTMMERTIQKGDSSGQDTMMKMDMTHDAMSMSMNDMGKMLEGKTGDELDRAFLEGMIPHHQAAVDMAKYIAGSSRPELVKLGGEIIAAQMKEIEQMKAWQIAWGYTSTGTTNNGSMNMMQEHCKTMPNMPGCEQYK